MDCGTKTKYLLDNYKNSIDFLFCYVLCKYTCILNLMTATPHQKKKKKLGQEHVYHYATSPFEQRQWSGTVSFLLDTSLQSLLSDYTFYNVWLSLKLSPWLDDSMYCSTICFTINGAVSDVQVACCGYPHNSWVFSFVLVTIWVVLFL